MRPSAPYQLESDSSSDDTGPAAIAFLRAQQGSQLGSGPSGAGKCRLSSLERVDHCHTLFLQNNPEQRGRQPLFFCKVSSHGVVFGVCGDTIRSLRSVMMCGVLRFGVSCIVFLSHSARLYNVCAWAARLAASFGFGGQYITIAVTSSCQLRSRMAPAVPCSFEGPSYVFSTFLGGFHIRLLTQIETPLDMCGRNPISPRSAARAARRWTCVRSHPRRGKKAGACPSNR